MPLKTKSEERFGIRQARRYGATPQMFSQGLSRYGACARPSGDAMVITHAKATNALRGHFRGPLQLLGQGRGAL